MIMEKIRCPWPQNRPLDVDYHDTEWGIPLHEDAKHYEFLLLDAFQAGLSWSTVLRKRKNFREAFDRFDYRKIALYDEAKVEALMQDAGIIRNRLKIKAAITNAQAFIELQKEFGSFDRFIWQFTGEKTIDNHLVTHNNPPVSSPESDAMSKALQKKGFKFVGTTICYAYMQAAGMVNDHRTDCFRYRECLAMSTLSSVS